MCFQSVYLKILIQTSNKDRTVLIGNVVVLWGPLSFSFNISDLLFPGLQQYVPPLLSLEVTTSEFEPTASYYAEQQQQHHQQQQLRSRPDCRESGYPTNDPPVPRYDPPVL
jgi:hypothetical protein